MTLTPFERIAFQMFRHVAAWQHERFHPRLGRILERARMPQDPIVYLAFLDLIAFISLLEGVLAALLVALVLPAVGVEVPLFGLIIAGMAPILLPFFVYTVGLLWPEVRANERGQQIDVMLPSALNYMAAMASSGMTPDRIIGSLGRQRVYGEVAHEAHVVSTEIRWTGRDMLTSLRSAVERSPSLRLQDIWQGMVATINSGANLKSYMLAKAEQMHRDNRSLQRQNLETLGVLAESFLVVAVAAPIFLIIMLTVMGSAGPSTASSLTLLWLLVLVMVPAAQAGFALTVRSMRGRV